MKATTSTEVKDLSSAEEAVVGDHQPSMMFDGPAKGIAAQMYSGMVVGDLIALKDDGCTPLVVFPGQTGSVAVPARSVVDLRGRHIGSQVALMFDGGDSAKPIVVGVLKDGDAGPLDERGGVAELEADGERLIVTAKQQLILRCGSASITLTKAGKVIIQGTFVSSRSSGVNRIVGGSVQIN